MSTILIPLKTINDLFSLCYLRSGRKKRVLTLKTHRVRLSLQDTLRGRLTLRT